MHQVIAVVLKRLSYWEASDLRHAWTVRGLEQRPADSCTVRMSGATRKVSVFSSTFVPLKTSNFSLCYSFSLLCYKPFSVSMGGADDR